MTPIFLAVLLPSAESFGYLDTELLEQPNLNTKENSALFHYLLNVSGDSKIAVAVLQTLLEERRLAHKERWNEDGVLYKFAKEGVVKAHVQVQSKQDSGEVEKLSYKARGPFYYSRRLRK